jgi:hypothetical protein
MNLNLSPRYSNLKRNKKFNIVEIRGSHGGKDDHVVAAVLGRHAVKTHNVEPPSSRARTHSEFKRERRIENNNEGISYYF